MKRIALSDPTIHDSNQYLQYITFKSEFPWETLFLLQVLNSRICLNFFLVDDQAYEQFRSLSLWPKQESRNLLEVYPLLNVFF